jgi:hypothetical protein
MFSGNPLAVVLHAHVGGRCVAMTEGAFHPAGVE